MTKPTEQQALSDTELEDISGGPTEELYGNYHFKTASTGFTAPGDVAGFTAPGDVAGVTSKTGK